MLSLFHSQFFFFQLRKHSLAKLMTGLIDQNKKRANQAKESCSNIKRPPGQIFFGGGEGGGGAKFFLFL